MAAQKFFHGFVLKSQLSRTEEDNSNVGGWPEDNSPEENGSSKL